MSNDLRTELLRRVLGFEVWEIILFLFGVAVPVIIVMFSFCLLLRKTKIERKKGALPLVSERPHDSDEIKEISIDEVSANNNATHEGILSMLNDKFDDKDSEKGFAKSKNGDDRSQLESFACLDDKDSSIGSRPSPHNIAAPSPLLGLPEFSHLGWGYSFTLRDLRISTDQFSVENIIGEGGYGIVYRGRLVNGVPVAVKKLLNNLGQADKEFTVEVEAIGHVRHKNLVRLLGYCIEGTHRLLVYEYVNNGNLEQWLHKATHYRGGLTWEARVKILLGTAKALAYLHEAIEPKIVHRDIKSSNILIDDDFNAKISDFGLAKLLGAGKSHVTTRVMGTFGYVAPEYANSGLLNEKSDIYSFGVLLLEAITGREPVDYRQPAPEVNLVNWLKMMIGRRRSEEVIDPNLEVRPSISTLKRALLTALRCVDPDADNRPKMSQVVRMLEAEIYPISREDQSRRRSQSGAAVNAEPPRASYETDRSDASGARSARMKFEHGLRR